MVTLSISDPDAAGLHTYTCSGSDCALPASTIYFVVMSTADTFGVHFYQLTVTQSNNEARHHTGNGWSIANTGQERSLDAWADLASGETSLLHIAAGN